MPSAGLYKSKPWMGNLGWRGVIRVQNRIYQYNISIFFLTWIPDLDVILPYIIKHTAMKNPTKTPIMILFQVVG